MSGSVGLQSAEKPERLAVALEPAVWCHQAVQRDLSGMAKRGMPRVVGESDGFDQLKAGEQHLLVSGLLVGRTGPKDVHGAARAVDVYDVKADAEAILAAIGAPAKVQILRGAREWWHPGRHGRICLGPKKVLAVFGEVHPKILREMGVKGPAMAFTIWPEEVPQPKNTSAAKGALEISDLQAVERDFAFVVDTQVAALDLVNAAAGADKALIADVRVFD